MPPETVYTRAGSCVADMVNGSLHSIFSWQSVQAFIGHVRVRRPRSRAASVHRIQPMSKAGGKAAVATIVKLMVPAGKASAQPPVGPALGAKGVKAMDFAKEFNARTADLEPGLLTPTVVTIQPDRTFSFKTLSMCVQTHTSPTYIAFAEARCEYHHRSSQTRSGSHGHHQH